MNILMHEMNPWWHVSAFRHATAKPRQVHKDLDAWLDEDLPQQVLWLSGPSGAGKTGLCHHVVNRCLDGGWNPRHVLYLDVSHPLLAIEDPATLLNEVLAQCPDIPERVLLIVDAWPLVENPLDAMSGRFRSLPLRILVSSRFRAPASVRSIALQGLSFFEYASLVQGSLALPLLGGLGELFSWSSAQWDMLHASATNLGAMFSGFALRGNLFPMVTSPDTATAQGLSRDLAGTRTAELASILGIRKGRNLTTLLSLIATSPSADLDLLGLGEVLGAQRPSIQSYLEALEMAGMVRLLRPYGYGDRIQRSRWRAYPTDHGLGPSLRYQRSFPAASEDDNVRLLEQILLNHLVLRANRQNLGFGVRPGTEGPGRGLVVVSGARIIPFEVLPPGLEPSPDSLGGLLSFCREEGIRRAYVLTWTCDHCGVCLKESGVEFLAIPAPYAAWWLGQAESRWP